MLGLLIHYSWGLRLVGFHLLGFDCRASEAYKGFNMGVRIRGTLGDIDPLIKVPFKRATSRIQKGPL